MCVTLNVISFTHSKDIHDQVKRKCLEGHSRGVLLPIGVSLNVKARSGMGALGKETNEFWLQDGNTEGMKYSISPLVLPAETLLTSLVANPSKPVTPGNMKTTV